MLPGQVAHDPQYLPLIDRVPVEAWTEVELFARGGLAVLGKIEILQYNVWHRRPTLAKWEKASLFAGAVWRHWRTRPWITRQSPVEV